MAPWTWRALVVVLLLANGVFFAWSRDWLDPLLGGTRWDDREPLRLARQIRPEDIRIRSAKPSAASAAVAWTPVRSAPEAMEADAASASMAASAAPVVAATPAASATPTTGPTACLQAGPFSDSDAAGLGRELGAAGVAADQWRMVDAAPLRWWVYMGRYDNDEIVTRKSEELRRINVRYDAVRVPADLSPGLVLARLPEQAQAEAEWTRLISRGVRTARVIEVPGVPPGRTVLVANADAALQARLQALRSPTLAGRSFAPCPTANATGIRAASIAPAGAAASAARTSR